MPVDDCESPLAGIQVAAQTEIEPTELGSNEGSFALLVLVHIDKCLIAPCLLISIWDYSFSAEKIEFDRHRMSSQKHDESAMFVKIPIRLSAIE
jgi:hypothetical protein